MRALPLSAALLSLLWLNAAVAQSQGPQPMPQGQPLAQPEQQPQADHATTSESGKAGKEEPSVAPPHTSDNSAVLVNGNWNVPGAPKDSQTVPSKFSARNAALDKLPIMAFPLALDDAQRARIAATVLSANTPAAKLEAPAKGQLTEELPVTVELRELPDAIKSEMEGVHGLKYVALDNRILLVNPSNRIVVGEIKR